MTTTSRSSTSAIPSGSLPDESTKEIERAIDQQTSTSSGIATGDRSSVTTPGPEPPGAFPRASMTEVSSTPTNIGETAKQTVSGVYVAAHHRVEDAYLTAQHGVEGVYTTAEHAARQYLPTSVVDTLEGVGVLRDDSVHKHEPSLPTHDSESKPPITEEIGSLPRSNAEADVSDIPEGRSVKSQGKGGGSGTMGASHASQSPYKPSPLSTTTYASPPIPLDTTYSTPLCREANNLTTAASANPDMNPFRSKQPGSPANSRENKNPFRYENSTTTASPQLSPVSSTGTLTSPDRDAQAAAHADRNTTMGRGDGGTDVGATSGTVANTKGNPNGDTNKDTMANISPPYRTEGDDDDNARHGTGSHEASCNASSGDGLAKGGIGENGSEGHTSKPSFVQKMKGEAKAFAEKMKTKTRG